MQPAPPRFNMARYCLAPAAHRPAEHTGLVVVHDATRPTDTLERWGFARLDDAVRACAAGLLDAGLVPGDRLVLRLGNRSEVTLLFFGALAAGIVAVPTSSQLTAEELAFVLDDTGAAALAVSEDLEVGDASRPRIRPVDVGRWIAHGERAAYADTAADDPAFLVYTSGTSGVPKGVLHAHRSAWGRRPMYAGWYGIGPTDVMLHAGAFNWTYTLGVGLTDPWAVGATAVVVAGERARGGWPGVLAATGATIFAAVPGVYRQLLDRARPDELALPALRHGLTAGEALAPSLWRRWREATGLELYEALGMSEISTFVSSSPMVPTRPGSPGRPQQGRRVAVLPTDRAAGTRPLVAGHTGLLAVHRSDPGLMLGYWNRPEEDAAALRGEWFVSGDLVHLEDGYVIHHGRSDDVMTSMGYRVSPLEVEHCLVRHPGVADAGVAQTSPRDGIRLITAIVVPEDAASPPLEEEVLAHCRAHLAAYKCPRRVVLVDALPRTPNGKIRRGRLRNAGID